MSATGSPPRVRCSVSSMSAPIAASTSSRPVRVGFTPTPCRVISASGWTVAATIHAAAVLMSPGTLTSTARRSPSGGVIVTLSPAPSIVAPIAPSRRSVWSRVAAGCTTVVGPPAASPASSSADFTCAEATGVSTRRPPCTSPPWITIGGSVPSALAVMSTPSSRSGATMRPMGRLLSEPSPLSTLSSGSPASTPAISRIVVPELPQSSTPSGSVSAPRPAPCTISAPSTSSMRTPSARRQPIVAPMSSDSR